MDTTALTFIDLETTGLSPQYHRVIEVAAIRMNNGRVTDRFVSLVNPGYPVPPEITLLTGITSDQLEGAPVFDTVADKLADLVAGSVFVAHNARFDYSFLRSEFARLGRTFSAPVLCTAKLSRTLYPRYRHHSLDALIARHGFSVGARHRALDDTAVLADFWKHVSREFGSAVLAAAVRRVTKSASLPSAITNEAVRRLPETAGVYVFYGDDPRPLYIGKSINIRERVLSHFYESGRSTKEAAIFRGVRRIETHRTSGELGALLLESAMIKQLEPSYNRLLKKRTSLIAAVRTTTDAGYDTIRTADLSSLGPDGLGTVLAVYRTKKQMETSLIELSRQHKLCLKLLGVEKTRGRCFGNQLETCHGACAGDELPARYNMRFAAAFTNTRVKQWPFPGAIAIREGSTAHVVYRWCYLGNAENNDGGMPADPVFDYDTYKILSSFLLGKLRNRQILHIPPPAKDI